MKGKIEQVSSKEYKGKTYYSMKVGDTWYGTGIKAGGEKGDTVEFDAEQNDKGYWNAGNVKKVAGAQVTSQPATSSGGGGGDRLTREDQIKNGLCISWQAARNSANALLAVGASAGYNDFPDSLSKLIQKSDELTLKFFNSSQNPGGTNQPTKATNSAPRSEPEDEFNDEIPF